MLMRAFVFCLPPILAPHVPVVSIFRLLTYESVQVTFKTGLEASTTFFFVLSGDYPELGILNVGVYKKVANFFGLGLDKCLSRATLLNIYKK